MGSTSIVSGAFLLGSALELPRFSFFLASFRGLPRVDPIGIPTFSQRIAVCNPRCEAYEIAGDFNAEVFPVASSLTLPEAKRKLDRVQNERARERKEREEMGNKFVRLGSGGAAATVWGAVRTKFPRIEHFDAAGRVPTAPFLSGVAALGSLFADDGADVLEGIATGIGWPFMDGVGQRIAGKLP